MHSTPKTQAHQSKVHSRNENVRAIIQGTRIDRASEKVLPCSDILLVSACLHAWLARWTSTVRLTTSFGWETSTTGPSVSLASLSFSLRILNTIELALETMTRPRPMRLVALTHFVCNLLMTSCNVSCFNQEWDELQRCIASSDYHDLLVLTCHVVCTFRSCHRNVWCTESRPALHAARIKSGSIND